MFPRGAEKGDFMKFSEITWIQWKKEIFPNLIIRIACSLCLGLWVNSIWAGLFLFIFPAMMNQFFSKSTTTEVNINAVDSESFEKSVKTGKEKINL